MEPDNMWFWLLNTMRFTFKETRFMRSDIQLLLYKPDVGSSFKNQSIKDHQKMDHWTNSVYI